MDDMIVAGELVSFRVTIHARHTDQFSRWETTGKMDMLCIVAYRITEPWSIADTFGWVQQLGATLQFPTDAG